MMAFLTAVLVPILVIGVLVVVHEFGHFIVAKWCRVGVLKFAVGFGPALCRWRRGETTYQVGLIPLGGYVRMVGDMPDMITGPQATDEAVRENKEALEAIHGVTTDEERAVLADRSRWFVEKSLWQRAAIVFAGPLFNFVLAAVFVFFCVWFYGLRSLNEKAVIGSITKDAPAEKAGLIAGDLVKQVDGKPISDWVTLAQTINGGTGAPIQLLVERAGSEVTITATPRRGTLPLPNGEQKTAYFLGIGPANVHSSVSFFGAIEHGLLWTADRSLMTIWGIWEMIRGQISPKELAGPIYIFSAASDQAEQGLENLLYFTALLSVSLAVLNLLPIPILDGGHLLFFFMEALLGPISIRKKEIAQQVGMVFLLGLMVFAIKNDIFREPIPKSNVTWDENTAEKKAEVPPATAVEQPSVGK